MAHGVRGPILDVFRFLAKPRLIQWLVSLLFAVLIWQGQASAAELDLTWIDNSDGQAAFAIERKSAGGAFAEIGTQPPGINSYTDVSVTTGTIYCYRVRAFNAAGYSAYASEACGTAGGILDLTVSRSGTGTVTSSPAGINCGRSCAQRFPAAAPVTLTATPATNAIFNGWSGGGCSGTAPCTLVGNQAVAVRGIFTATYLLSVRVQRGSGTVSSDVEGIACGADCSQRYVSGTSVTLTATPNPGATFLGWSGACKGTSPCTLILRSNASVRAVFGE